VAPVRARSISRPVQRRPSALRSTAVIKLNGAPLALESRHVVLHGVDAATPLPSSVASLPGLPAYLTLPVACGEIRQVR